MTQATQSESLYTAYITTYRAFEAAQDELKGLRAAWKIAGDTVKRETAGLPIQERLAIAEKAIAPFKTACAEKEQEIARLRKETDEARNAWGCDEND